MWITAECAVMLREFSPVSEASVRRYIETGFWEAYGNGNRPSQTYVSPASAYFLSQR